MHSDQVPESEKQIYADLKAIRLDLQKLKNNRKEFMKSSDVRDLYGKVLGKYQELKEIRKKTGSAPSHAVVNKVDTILDETFQLISLCFMTVGLTKTAPATYASLSTVQRLLEHLEENRVYTIHDLVPIKKRLEEIAAMISQDEYTKVDEPESTSDVNKDDERDVLQQKLNICLNEYKTIEKSFDEISEDLREYLKELLEIRRILMSIATHHSDKDAEFVTKCEYELKQIENHRDENGNFLTKSNKQIKDQKGSNTLNGLLDECHNILNDLKSGDITGLVDPQVMSLIKKITKIKIALENLLVTRRWTLRETDLFTYQKELEKVDQKRVELQKQPDSSARGQRFLLYFLRRCYALIYKLLESSEPVSEALQPVHNQLSTVRRCLLDLKRMGGINSTRELYPYQMKLASIDDLRIDGKFIVDGQIPEGQGTLNALLAECYDICYELRIEFEERGGGGSGEETNDDDGKPDDVLERQYDALEEEDYDEVSDKNLSESEYDYDSYLPSENVTDNESQHPH